MAFAVRLALVPSRLEDPKLISPLQLRSSQVIGTRLLKIFAPGASGMKIASAEDALSVRLRTFPLSLLSTRTDRPFSLDSRFTVEDLLEDHPPHWSSLLR